MEPNSSTKKYTGTRYVSERKHGASIKKVDYANSDQQRIIYGKAFLTENVKILQEHERPAAGALVAAAVAAAEQFSSTGRGVGRGEAEVRSRVNALPPGGVRPPSPPPPPPPPRGGGVAVSKRAQSQHALALAAVAAASPGAAAAVIKQKPAAASRSLCSLAAAASPTRTVAPATVVPPAPTSPRAGALLTVEHGGGDRSTPLTTTVAPRRRLVLVCGSEKHTPPATPLLPTDTSDSDEGGGGDEGGCGGGVGGGTSGGVCGGRRRGPRIELASTVVRHSRRLVAAVLEGSGNIGSGGAEGGDAAERRRDAGDDGSSVPAVSAVKESAQKEAVDATAAPGGTAAQPPGGAGDSVPTPVDSGAAAEAQALEHHPNAQRTQVSAEPGIQSADSPNDPQRVSETWVQPSVRRGFLSGKKLVRSDGGIEGGCQAGRLGNENDETPGCEERYPTEAEVAARRRPRTPAPFSTDVPVDSKAKKQESLSPLRGHVQERRCREIAAKLWKIAAQMGCGDQLDPTLKILDSGEDILDEAMDEVVEGKDIQSESIESRMCSAERIRCKRNSIKIALEKVYENCKWAENLRICKSCQRRLLAFENGSDENILDSEYSAEDYADCFTKTIRRSRSRVRKGNNCLNENLLENQDFEKHGLHIWEKSRRKRKMRSFEKKIRCKALDLQWKDAIFTGLETTFLRDLSIRAAKYKHFSVTKKTENLRRLEYLWQQETRVTWRWLVPALAVKADLVFPLYCCEYKLNKTVVIPKNDQDTQNQSLSEFKLEEESSPPSNAVIITSNTIAVDILVEPLEHQTVALPCTVLSDPPPLSMISRLSVCTKLRHFVDRAGRKNADRWLLLDLLANRGSELRQERKRPFRACLILQTQALVLARNYRARMRCAVNAAVLLHIRPVGILRISNGFACVQKLKNSSNLKEVTSLTSNTSTGRIPKATADKSSNATFEGVVKGNKSRSEEQENQQRMMKRTSKRMTCNFEQPLNRKKEINATTKVTPKKTSDNVDNNRKRGSTKKKDATDVELRPMKNNLSIGVTTDVKLKDSKSKENECNFQPSDSIISQKPATVEPITLNATKNSHTDEVDNPLPNSNSSETSKKVNNCEEERVTEKPNSSKDMRKADVYGKGAGDGATVNQTSDLIWKTLFPKASLILNENNREDNTDVLEENRVSDAVENTIEVSEEKSSSIKQLRCSKPTMNLTTATELSTISNADSDEAKDKNNAQTPITDETSSTNNSCPSPNKQDLQETKHTEVNTPETEDNALSGQEDESPTYASSNTLDFSQEISDKANMSENTSTCHSSANVSDMSDEGSSRGTSSLEFDESVSFDGDPLRKFCSLTRLFRRKKAKSSPRILERGRKRKTIENTEEVGLPKEPCADGLDVRRKKKKDTGCILQ